MYLHWWQTVS